ncbi:hypothetical protein [Lacticaseibacillus sp. N501-2]|uniref:hypothetical protein n=1 Tax=Lacticaseibacillus salsurae TaxID=3367729 RepID=UPI0038B2E7FE
MEQNAQALYDLIDQAYPEHSDFEWNAAYNQILLKYAKQLSDGDAIETIRVPMYIELYQLPHFRPMTLSPVGRALYGKLHQDCHDYDAKQLRHQALAYGIIVAGATWGASFGSH